MPYVTRPRALHHRTATFWPGAMVAGGPVQVLSIAARRGSDGRSRLLALGIAYGRLGRASLNQLMRFNEEPALQLRKGCGAGVAVSVLFGGRRASMQAVGWLMGPGTL